MSVKCSECCMQLLKLNWHNSFSVFSRSNDRIAGVHKLQIQSRTIFTPFVFCSYWGSRVRESVSFWCFVMWALVFKGFTVKSALNCLKTTRLICVCLSMQVCKRKCSEVQRCTPCKQPRCAFAAPDGGLENGGVGGGGGEAASNSGTGHCHLPLCPLPSSSTSSSSASSSSSSPADGCCGLGLHADLPHSSDSSPCCLHHYDDCQARSSDAAADHLSINHLPSSILLKVSVHQRLKMASCSHLLVYLIFVLLGHWKKY